MADDIDMTTERMQRELDAALAALQSPTDSLPSALWCDECDDQIPEARRAAAPGCRLCIHCQGMYERGVLPAL